MVFIGSSSLRFDQTEPPFNAIEAGIYPVDTN
jgi:hypothetical protein